MIRPACLLALCFALSACETAYTRTFSPRLTRYEKPPEKAEPRAADLLPPEASGTTTVPGPSPLGLPPTQGAAPGANVPPNLPVSQ